MLIQNATKIDFGVKKKDVQDTIIETRTHTLTQLKENGGEKDNLAKRQSKSRS